MAWLENKEALGLDLGQATIKAVRLASDGKGIRLVEARKLACRGEGLLGDEEVRRELIRWFAESGWIKLEVVAALPQYLSSTQVSDFPAAAGTTLADMVKFETQHLAGLSGEPFVYDYATMPPRFGRANPVLIGMCRESVVRERAQVLLESGLRLADLAIAGPAVATAFHYLQPAAVEAEAPHLLLEIGTESSTLAIVAGGDILYTCSLMTGSDSFLAAGAPRAGDQQPEAADLRGFASVASLDREASASRAATLLEREIRGALDNWRADEIPEIAERPFAMIGLCGGGALVPGLDRYLGRAFGCPARPFGVAIPGENLPDPTLVTALGLALQGLGATPVALSLAPRDVRSLAKRRRRFGWLATAAAAIGVLVALGGFNLYRSLDQRATVLAAEIANLERCRAIVPELEKTTVAIDFQQRLLLPFVAKGNRAQRYMRTIAKLERALGQMTEKADDEGWVVYLADSNSFESGKLAAGGSGDRLFSGVTGGNPFFGVAGPVRPALGGLPPAAGAAPGMVVTNLRPLDSMVVGVVTTTEPDRTDPFRLVRRLVESLKDDGKRPVRGGGVDTKDNTLFGAVDLMAEPEMAGREDIFQAWRDLRRGTQNGSYRRFILRLPFRELDVNPTDQ